MARSRSRSGSQSEKPKSKPSRSRKVRSKRHRDSSSEDEGKARRTPSRDNNANAGASGDERESTDESQSEQPEVTILPEPIVSPRDLNHYRIIRLKNGFTAVLVSTLGYAKTDAERNLATRNKPTTSCNEKAERNYSRCIGVKRDKKCETKSTTGLGLEKPEACINKTVKYFDHDMVIVVPISSESRKSAMQQMMEDDYAEDMEVGEPDRPTSETNITAAAPIPVATTGDQDDEVDVFASEEPKGATAAGAPRKTTTSKGEGELRDIRHKWGPEHETHNKSLLNEEKHIMQQRSKEVEMVLTFATGSIHDKASTRGISHLAREAVVHALKDKDFSSEVLQFIPAEYTTIRVNANTGNLKEHCRRIVSHIKNMRVDRKDLLKAVDALDHRQEHLQCHGCWEDATVDERRLAILITLAKPEHPVRQISVGHLPSLWTALEKAGDSHELEKHIVEFVQAGYVGGAGTVAVKGPETLDNLQHAVQSFSALAQVGKASPSPDPEPFNTDKFKAFYNVLCTNPHCSGLGDAFLTIAWALPAAYWKDFDAKPLDYLGALISDPSVGSLGHQLREKNLAWELHAGCDARYKGVHRNEYCSLFEIQATLSEDGLKNVDEVVAVIFAYLKFLQRNGPSRSFYRDHQKVASAHFHALAQDVNINSQFPAPVAKLSVGLQLHEPRNLLIAPVFFRKYDEEVFQNISDLFVAETANIMLCACMEDLPAYSEKDLQVEPVFGTKFFQQKITPERLKAWSSPPSTSFALPGSNPFIHEDSCLVDAEDLMGLFNVFRPDPVAKNAENYRVWHHQDRKEDHFAIYYIHVVSPASSFTLNNSVMLEIWALLLNANLKPVLGPAVAAGIKYNLKPTPYGIQITVYSWNSKLPNVVKIILREIAKFGSDANKELFKKWKKGWMKHTAGLIKDEYVSNHLVASELYHSIINKDGWNAVEKYNAVQPSTLANFEEFLGRFKNMYSVVALLHGNVNRTTASEFTNLMEGTLPPNWPVNYFLICQNLLEKGDRVFRFPTLSNFSSENYVYNAYQIGPTCTMTRVISDFIFVCLAEYVKHKFSEPADFYISPRLMEYQGDVTLVLEGYGYSESHKLKNLDKAADELLLGFYDERLSNLGCDFKRFKQELADQYSAGAPTTESWTGNEAYDLKLHGLYRAIEDMTFRFSELQCKLQSLQKLKLQDVQALFKARLYAEESNCHFRKASVQIRGSELKDKTGIKPPPRTREEWRMRRKTLRECTFDERHTLAHAHKTGKNEKFEIKLEPEVRGKCTNEHFITDIEAFKRTLFHLPDGVCEE